MIKFRIECCSGSKYFSEHEKNKADLYFETRVKLNLPAEYWIMYITAFGSTQILLKKTIN